MTKNSRSSHSESLKVMYFVVSGKAIRGQIIRYNNVGLISEVTKDVASKAPKIHVFDYPMSFDAAVPGNPREYPHTLYIARN